jgi:NADPH2:quinone reductase
MRAAWYEMQGPARDVLHVSDVDTPEPGADEVRVAVHASGVNPGEVKKRADTFSRGLPYPRVIPHSDGAGVIDQVGTNVDDRRLGERVWCFGAQSYRPFGTAAEYCVVPARQAVHLPDATSFERGACLGIPGTTAHRCVFAGGDVRNKTVLVQGGAGAVGQCAVQLALQGGARVIAAVRSRSQVASAREAGASDVVIADEELAQQVRAISSAGVDHIVEVAFGANIATDIEILSPAGSISTYATDAAEPVLPFWPLVFGNATIHFLGSDDFSSQDKEAAAQSINEALEAGWQGLPIAETFPLDEIASAHEAVEHSHTPGKVVVLP